MQDDKTFIWLAVFLLAGLLTAVLYIITLIFMEPLKGVLINYGAIIGSIIATCAATITLIVHTKNVNKQIKNQRELVEKQHKRNIAGKLGYQVAKLNDFYKNLHLLGQAQEDLFIEICDELFALQIQYDFFEEESFARFKRNILAYARVIAKATRIHPNVEDEIQNLKKDLKKDLEKDFVYLFNEQKKYH